jgi:hypothetical protein
MSIAIDLLKQEVLETWIKYLTIIDLILYPPIGVILISSIHTALLVPPLDLI